MATYTQLDALRNSVALKAKAATALALVSQYILDGGGGNPLFMNVGIIRQAKAVLFDNQGAIQADRFMWHLALDATIQANGDTSTDAQVRAVIDAKLVNIWSA